MPRCELGRRYAPERTVGSLLVIVMSPFGNHDACMCEIIEVVVIEALIAEFAVEALDICILGWFACSDQLQIHAALVGPAVECSAGELRSLVCTNCAGQS